MKQESVEMLPLERCQNALDAVRDAFVAVFGLHQQNLRPRALVELEADKHSDPCLKIDGWIFLTPGVMDPADGNPQRLLGRRIKPAAVWELTTGVWERSFHRDEPDNFEVTEIETDGTLADCIRKAVELVSENFLKNHWEAESEKEIAHIEEVSQSDTADEPS